MPPGETLVAAAGVVTVLAGGVAGTGYLVRGVWRGSRAIHRLAEELLGDDDRPSAMARLVAIESEMKPNGGSSLRDALDRCERRLDDHLDAHRMSK